MNNQLPDEIIEAYVFANTPAYLYRKLVESDYVRDLAERPMKDLIEILQRARRDNINSVANAYAALIATLRKNVNPIDALTPDSAEKLEWASVLISLYKQKHISTNVTTIRAPKIFTQTADVSKASLNNITVTMVQKHD